MEYNTPIALHTPMLAKRGGHKDIGKIASNFGCKKVVILCDEGIEKLGLPAKIAGYLKEAGIDSYVDNRVKPDPPDVTLDAMAEKAKAEGVDGIVAVGGGSTMDSGKGVKLILGNGGKAADWLNNLTTPQQPGVPLITIATTSGTGAECTPGGVITDTANEVKKVVAGIGCVPAYAIVDAELCVGIPPKGSAACAFDVLAHAVDGIVSTMTSLLNHSLCVEAIRLFKDSLFEVYYNGANIEAREQMHVAAALGGFSIVNANCSLIHAFAHALGAKFHAVHGNCCAIFTPPAIEFVAEAVPYEVEVIAQAFGIKYEAGTDIKEIAARTARHIFALTQAVKMPTIADIAPNREDAYKIIPVAQTDLQAMFTPKPLTEEGCKWIIDKAYEYLK